MTSTAKNFWRNLGRNICAACLRLRSSTFYPENLRGRVMIIAPHQDDETFGCGGLISSLSAGGRSPEIVFLTDGTASHPNHPKIAPSEIGKMRRREALSALAQLGVRESEVRFLDAPDSRLPTLSQDERLDLAGRLSQAINEVGPSHVFLPSRRDGSTEHLAAHGLVLESLQAASNRPQLVEYLVWGWFSPRLLFSNLLAAQRVWRLPIKKVHEKKLQAIASYRSQTQALAPWEKPVLPEHFAAAFAGGCEYFFTD